MGMIDVQIMGRLSTGVPFLCRSSVLSCPALTHDVDHVGAQEDTHLRDFMHVILCTEYRVVARSSCLLLLFTLLLRERRAPISCLCHRIPRTVLRLRPVRH
jgi:hypothetical protein